jgi:methionyl-tRNA formyltransferase
MSTYWPRLSTDKHGFIDWGWSLSDVESFICAFDDPYAGAATFINSKKVRLKKCFADYNDGHFHPFQKGIVYRKSSDALFVAFEDGALVIRSIMDEKKMNVMNEISVGDRFFTPYKFLESAMQFRAIYSAKK